MYMQDHDPNDIESIVANAARHAYWLYQRQLWQDDFDPNCELHYHIWGDFGVCLVDSRVCRSFTYSPNDKYQYFGSIQWKKFREVYFELNLNQN